MAQFMGYVKGQRGEATRLGSKNSGLVVRANGWDSGVRVTAFVDSEGRDVFSIHVTGGSNKGAEERHLGLVVGGVWSGNYGSPRHD